MHVVPIAAQRPAAQLQSGGPEQGFAAQYSIVVGTGVVYQTQTALAAHERPFMQAAQGWSHRGGGKATHWFALQSASPSQQENGMAQTAPSGEHAWPMPTQPLRSEHDCRPPPDPDELVEAPPLDIVVTSPPPAPALRSTTTRPPHAPSAASNDPTQKVSA